MLLLRSRLVRAVGRAGALALAARTLTACFSTVPVSTDARPVGANVVLDITDRGRLNVGSALGPSPLRVEGRLTAATDSTLSLAVSRVEGLRGESTAWSGEAYTLRRDDVGLVRVRQVSRARTALVILAGVGAAVLAVVGISLAVDGGIGSNGSSQKPGGENGGT